MNRKLFLMLTMLVFCLMVSGQVKWTFMVYLDGDNDLEEFAMLDFNEMERVGSSADVNIIVQFDRIPDYDTTQGDWSETRRYKVIKDTDTNKITSPVLQNLGEKNMGDSSTLISFIEWTKTNYPANNYALILWNHGGGWRKKSTGHEIISTSSVFENKSAEQIRQLLLKSRDKQNLITSENVVKDVCWDDTDADHLSSKEVSQALKMSNFHPDIIAFDACLMAMIENCFQLKNNAGILVGSEETEPGDGWKYNTLLEDLKSNPNITTRALSDKMVQRYGESYINNEVTQSAIDLSKIKPIVTALDSMVSYIIRRDSFWDTIADVYINTESYDEPDNLDLADFANELYNAVSDDVLKQRSLALYNAVNAAVIRNYATNGAYDDSRGISIYFPYNITIDYGYLNGKYRIAMPDSSLWDEFLAVFITKNPPAPDYTEPNDFFAMATVISNTNSVPVKGFFKSSNDLYDVYRFFNAASADVHIELEVPADYDLFLYSVIDYNTTLLDYSAQYDTTKEELLYPSLPEGYYFIVVKPFDLSNEPYKLRISGIVIDAAAPSTLTYSYELGSPSWTTTSILPMNGIANTYYVPLYSMTELKGVWYYITDIDVQAGGGNSGRFKFYGRNEYLDDQGNPHLINLLADSIRYFTPADTGWNYIDLDADNIILFDRFLVGLYWDGTNTPGIGYDSVDIFDNAFECVNGVWNIKNGIRYYIRPVVYNPNNDGYFPGPSYCDGSQYLTAETDSFDDGSGLLFYGNLQDCSWLIEVPTNKNIHLSFDTLDLEDGYDFLDIYDYDGGVFTHIGRYTGNDLPADIISTYNSLYLNFTSDKYVTSDGWKVHYTSVVTDKKKSPAESEIRIWPNPANSLINVNSSADISNIKLIDMYGRQLLEFSSCYSKIDVSSLNTGLYLLKIQTNQGLITKTVQVLK